MCITIAIVTDNGRIRIPRKNSTNVKYKSESYLTDNRMINLARSDEENDDSNLQVEEVTE